MIIIRRPLCITLFHLPGESSPVVKLWPSDRERTCLQWGIGEGSIRVILVAAKRSMGLECLCGAAHLSVIEILGLNQQP